MQEVKILFDPVAHRYTDELGREYTSATTLLGKYKPDYDYEFWAMYRALDQTGYKLRPDTEARRIYVQGGYITPQWYSLNLLFTGIIRTHKSVEVIIAEWKQEADIACHYGNEKHGNLETGIKSLYTDYTQAAQITSDLYDYKIETFSDLDKYDVAYIDTSIYELLVSLINKGYILYTEHRVYSTNHLVSGTIDLLAINDKREFIIIDWKTNKDELKFESGYYKKVWNETRTHKIATNEWIKTKDFLKAPLEKLYNCKGVLYGLQLALYAFICELWGYTHKGSLLCHIRRKVTNIGSPIFKDNGTHDFYNPLYYKFSNVDYKDAVKSIMQARNVPC